MEVYTKWGVIIKANCVRSNEKGKGGVDCAVVRGTVIQKEKDKIARVHLLTGLVYTLLGCDGYVPIFNCFVFPNGRICERGEGRGLL